MTIQDEDTNLVIGSTSRLGTGTSMSAIHVLYNIYDTVFQFDHFVIPSLI